MDAAAQLGPLARSEKKGAGQSSPAPANDDRKSAIVTIRRYKAAVTIPPGLLPDTPEEHRRRGEAATATTLARHFDPDQCLVETAGVLTIASTGPAIRGLGEVGELLMASIASDVRTALSFQARPRQQSDEGRVRRIANVEVAIVLGLLLGACVLHLT
jgi:hypothetical protein